MREALPDIDAQKSFEAFWAGSERVPRPNRAQRRVDFHECLARDIEGCSNRFEPVKLPSI